MKRLFHPLFSIALLIVAAGGAAPAAAQSASDSAQALFDEGVKRMAQGDYRAAVARFEESYKQEPALGTRYKLAIAYEKLGRFASALAAWKEVADRLEQAGEKEKAREAKKLADNLVPKLAHLQVIVAPEAMSTDGIVIKCDGVAIGRAAWGTSVPVDPGEHRIIASAPQKKTWEKSITAQGGGAPVEVRVPLLEGTPPPVPPSEGLSGQRIAALVAGAVGVVGLGVGSGLGGAALAQWGAVKSGEHCQLDPSGKLIPNRCDATAIAMGRNADTLATASNVSFAIGGAGLVAAGILWLTARSNPRPAAARWVAPLVSPGGLGVAAGARF